MAMRWQTYEMAMCMYDKNMQRGEKSGYIHLKCYILSSNIALFALNDRPS